MKSGVLTRDVHSLDDEFTVDMLVLKRQLLTVAYNDSEQSPGASRY